MITHTVVVTGAAGQDGLILLNRLKSTNLRVLSIVKNQSQRQLIERILPEVDCVVLDLTNSDQVDDFFKNTPTKSIYNFASQSSVAQSWENPLSTFETNFISSMNILEGIRKYNPKSFIVTPISGDIFGNCTPLIPHSEESTFNPLSPYGISKISVYHLHKMYLESFNLFVSTPILFNHESPLRSTNFLSKKICQGVAKIYLGGNDRIEIENKEIKRDWGWAPDYVTALQHIMKTRDTNLYIISTGQAHSVMDFLDCAFNAIGILDWSDFVTFRSKPKRPNDIYLSYGDSTKFKFASKWNQSFTFKELVNRLVNWEIYNLRTKQSSIWREDFNFLDFNHDEP